MALKWYDKDVTRIDPDLKLAESIDDNTQTVLIDGERNPAKPAEWVEVPYILYIGNECLIVSDDSAWPSLTCARGTRGTDPAEHAAGAAVDHVIDVKGIRQIVSKSIFVGPTEPDPDPEETTDGLIIWFDTSDPGGIVDIKIGRVQP